MNRYEEELIYRLINREAIGGTYDGETIITLYDAMGEDFRTVDEAENKILEDLKSGALSSKITVYPIMLGAKRHLCREVAWRLCRDNQAAIAGDFGVYKQGEDMYDVITTGAIGVECLGDGAALGFWDDFFYASYEAEQTPDDVDFVQELKKNLTPQAVAEARDLYRSWIEEHEQTTLQQDAQELLAEAQAAQTAALTR